MATKADRSKAMIECRTFGHAWERYAPDDKRRPPFGWRESVRCIRGCGTSRHDIIDVNGDVASREYDYDSDYKYAADEMPSRAEFRVLLHKLDLDETREQRNGRRAS